MSLPLSPEGFFRVLSFLTRIPVPKRFHAAPGEVFRLEGFWFPVVGAVIGSFLGLCSFMLHRFSLPSFLSAFVILVLWIVLTGGLHLDGVADTMECALSEVSAEDKRRIRKDPRKGVFAIVALILAILGKWIGIVSAVPPVEALFLAPLLSRAAIVPVFRILARAEGAPDGGLGRLLLGEGATGKSWVAPLVVLLISGGAAAFLAGERGVWAALFSVSFTFLIGKAILGKTDGLSGDLAGLLIESGEILFLLALFR